MLINTGIDIVEVTRMKKAVERWGNRFTKRIFTDSELAYAYQNRFPYQHLAGRFAVKEAVSKAIGNGSATMWKEIEVSRNKKSIPQIILHGKTRSLCKRNKISEIQISISHTKSFAVANAIVIKNGRKRDNHLNGLSKNRIASLRSQ